MMIDKNLLLPDNFFELERCDTFGDYSRMYGDQIAEKFEDLNIIYIPYFPLDFDINLFQSVLFPEELAKIGTKNGLDKSVIVRDQKGLSFDANHVLNKISESGKISSYFQHQISSVNYQIRMAMRYLFPKYFTLLEGNITWRLTPTNGDGLHFDYYHNSNGRPEIIDKSEKNLNKIKLFINIDSEPRVWWTSRNLIDFITIEKNKLPNSLPDDINLLNSYISTKVLNLNYPYHEIRYPQLSAILFNSEAVSHHIVSGSRAIDAQFAGVQSDMINPEKIIYNKLSKSINDNGFKVAINSTLDQFL